MDKKLKEILDMLDKFNSKINLVNKKDLDEQYDNLEDFKVVIRDLDITLKNLDILLNNFNCLEQKDGDELERNLFELHRILTAFEWHFSEINDLNMKIIKVYKDKIDA